MRKPKQIFMNVLQSKTRSITQQISNSTHFPHATSWNANDAHFTCMHIDDMYTSSGFDILTKHTYGTETNTQHIIINSLNAIHYLHYTYRITQTHTNAPPAKCCFNERHHLSLIVHPPLFASNPISFVFCVRHEWCSRAMVARSIM